MWIFRRPVSLWSFLILLIVEDAIVYSTVPSLERDNHQVIQRERALNRSPVQAETNSLRHRATFSPILVGSEWIFDHHDFTCLLPVASAAAQLTNFYEDIAVYAALTTTRPMRHWSMSVGEITLEVIAPLGTLVEWAVVQGFANLMLDMTKRGYTNSYQINIVNRMTGRLLTFNLYVGYLRAAVRIPPSRGSR